MSALPDLSQILVSFVAELGPYLAELQAAFDQLAVVPDDRPAATRARQHLRTIRSAATMLDLADLAAGCDAVEQAVEAARFRSAPFADDQRARFAGLPQALAALAQAHVERREAVGELLAQLQTAAAALAAAPGHPSGTPPAAEPPPAPDLETLLATLDTALGASAPAGPQPGPAAPTETTAPSADLPAPEPAAPFLDDTPAGEYERPDEALLARALGDAGADDGADLVASPDAGPAVAPSDLESEVGGPPTPPAHALADLEAELGAWLDQPPADAGATEGEPPTAPLEPVEPLPAGVAADDAAVGERPAPEPQDGERTLSSAESAEADAPPHDSARGAAEARADTLADEPTLTLEAEATLALEAPGAGVEDADRWARETRDAEPLAPRRPVDQDGGVPSRALAEPEGHGGEVDADWRADAADPSLGEPEASDPLVDRPIWQSDPEILEIFRQESAATLADLADQLGRLRARPEDAAALEAARLLAHRLKGAMSTVGLTGPAGVCALLEAGLDGWIAAGERQPGARPVTRAGLDWAERALAEVARLLSEPEAAPAPLPPFPAAEQTGAPELAAEEEAPPERAPEDEAEEHRVPWRDRGRAREPHPTRLERHGDPEAPGGGPDAEPELPAELFAEPAANPFEPWWLSAEPRADPASDDLAGDGEASDDLAALLAAFRPEAEEHLATFQAALLRLEQRPDDRAPLAEARRAVHTLKGAAALLGFERAGRVCHDLEDLLDRLVAGALAVDSDTLAVLFAAGAAIDGLIQQPGAAAVEVEIRQRLSAALGASAAAEPAGGAALLAEGPAGEEPAAGSGHPNEPRGPLETESPTGPPSPPAPPLPQLREREPGGEAPAPEPSPEPDPPLALAAEGQGTPTRLESRWGPRQPADRAAPAPASEPAAESAGSVRVELAQLDELLDTVGELVINRSGLEQRLGRLIRIEQELALSLRRLRQLAQRLEDHFEVAELLRGAAASASERTDTPLAAEFDELELDRYTELHRFSRELTELAADVAATGSELGGARAELAELLDRQARTASALQERLLGARLVPIGSLAVRLERAVRSAALQEGKEVELRLEGGETMADKLLIEELADALVHLVRNAVAHGIEPPEERRRLGKPARGLVVVFAARAGNAVRLEVRDDGRGIDERAVLARAVELGLVAPGAAPSGPAALDLIFRPGFSTRPVADPLAGRGVGLDVVRERVSRLKGAVTVASSPGRGAQFVLRVPARLAMTRALAVQAGGRDLAVPAAEVRRVLMVRPAELSLVGNEPVLQLDGEPLPVVYLDEALGLDRATRERERAPALVLASRPAALVVDRLAGQQEIVVKPLLPPLRAVRGVAGATVTGSGAVLLVLNPADLAGGGAPHAAQEAAWGPRGAQRLAGAELSAAPPRSTPREVLVVDDSLSIRRVVSRALERAGWRPVQARDGREALDLLRTVRPAAVVLDVEMPRMDGFELLGVLRGQPEFRALPVIMLTSRAGDKHRAKALQLGASAYLVKPYNEEQLLALLAGLTGAAGLPEVA